jgi:predicted glycosyltransferase
MPAMRLLVVLNPLCGLGHAAVVGGILRGLRRFAPQTAAVVVSGGPPIPPGLIPDDADLVQLPALLPSEGLFSEILPRAANLSRSTVRKMRRRMLSALVRTLRPDVVVVEHYPFGRHAFAKEIEPLLDEIAVRLPHASVVSSLSVLGGRAPEHRREPMVIDTARRRFHRLLLHTDPRLETLEDDYPAAARELAPKIGYTGYVVPRPVEGEPAPALVRQGLGVGPRERLLVVHTGGGRDGAAAMRLALEGFRALRRPLFAPRLRLLAVSGPALSLEEAGPLEALARRIPGARFERHRPDLFACVRAADAVVCMAGYATCAELLAAKVPALLLPRRSDGEQVRRAERLERLGVAHVLPAGAGPDDVARALPDLLRQPYRAPHPAPDLGGAEAAAREIVAAARASALASAPGAVS